MAVSEDSETSSVLRRFHAWIEVDLSSYALPKGHLMEEDTLMLLPELNFIVFNICCGFAFLIQTSLTVY